jgi:hypothetical protein
MHENPQQLERLARLVEHALSQPVGRRELIRRGLALGLSLPAIGAALAACGVEPPAAGEGGTISRWQPTPSQPTPPLQAPQPSQPPPLSGDFQPVQGAATPAQPAAPTTAPPPAAGPALRFAVIGDYGQEGEPQAAVSAMVASWAPDCIVTTGDNNYPDGAAETIDRNVGQYYSAFISPYRGAFGPGASENRFWPVLGNHDWVVGYPEPYLGYFSLPDAGRYYTVERGPVALFALDSMPGEPDGWTSDSPQALWLQGAMAASAARWKLVVFHHSPFSSGHWGSSDWMQWPFAAWGAQLVLSGHDHTYERVQRDGIVYVVNGLGGGARYAPGFSPAEGSQIFFNADHGAMLVEADEHGLRARFITRAEQPVDEFAL